MPATHRCDPRLTFGPVPLVAAGALLPFSLCVVLPTTPTATLFVSAPVSLRLACATFLCAAPVAVLVTRGSVTATRATGPIVAVVLSTTTGFRLRLRLRLLWLCLSPLPLRLPALLSAVAPLFAGPCTLRPFATPAPLFAGPRALRPFVGPTPLFRAGALPGMAPRATLPLGFLVGTGGRYARQGQRAADGDRTALSTPLSREAHHVPARLRAPGRARERP
jgi:hypothetical protein